MGSKNHNGLIPVSGRVSVCEEMETDYLVVPLPLKLLFKLLHLLLQVLQLLGELVGIGVTGPERLLGAKGRTPQPAGRSHAVLMLLYARCC